MLTFANKVEQVHANLFQRALDTLAQGKDLEAMGENLCDVA